MTSESLYRYAWHNNEKRATLFNRTCRVLRRWRNSRLVEFLDNGQREVVSGNALRKDGIIDLGVIEPSGARIVVVRNQRDFERIFGAPKTNPHGELIVTTWKACHQSGVDDVVMDEI